MLEKQTTDYFSQEEVELQQSYPWGEWLSEATFKSSLNYFLKRKKKDQIDKLIDYQKRTSTIDAHLIMDPQLERILF